MQLPRTPEPEVMDSREEARDYDSMEHSQVNRCFVDDLLEFVNCQPDRAKSSSGHDAGSSSIVDLGTGTAQIPVLLTRQMIRPHAILAVDLSWEMLLLAQKNVAQASCEQTVIPVFASARQLPVPDQSCQQVISNSIVHHIPDPTDVFREVRRISGPGTVIFIRDLLRPQSGDMVEDLVTRWAADATSHQQEMFRASLHAAFTVSEVREMLSVSGLNPRWVRQTTDRHWTIAGRVES